MARRPWITAAIFCSAPPSPRPDEFYWWWSVGGPIRPFLHSAFVGMLPGSDGFEREEGHLVSFPRVRFEVPGVFTIVVSLLPPSEGDVAFQTVELPLRLHRPTGSESHRQTLPPELSYLPLRQLEAELGARLTAGSTRMVRYAADEAKRFGHTVVGTGHMLIALRRGLGASSGLPPTTLLREAQEQLDGLLLPTGPREMLATPRLAKLLRTACGSHDSPAGPEVILDALRNLDGPLLGIADEAWSVARRQPV